MDQSEVGITPAHLFGLGITDCWRCVRRHWSLLIEPPVPPVSVVVDDVVGQDIFQMASTEDQHPVQTLMTDGVDEALGEGVGPRCAHRGADDPDPLSLEDLVELVRELGVSVTDQEPGGMGAVVELHAQVSRLLHHPRSDRVGGDTRRLCCVDWSSGAGLPVLAGVTDQTTSASSSKAAAMVIPGSASIPSSLCPRCRFWMKAWPSMITLAVWSRLRPRIGRSLALRRPWSASTRLLAHYVVS